MAVLGAALLVAAPPATAQAPAATTGRATDTAGSAPVGTAGYPVPRGAVFVSPSGTGRGPGTAAAPWRTLAQGLKAAPDGATVVLREGTYVESVVVPKGKRLTLQSHPGEAVWLDGSRAVTGWTRDGTTWRVDGWTAQFDHSPTYTKGAPDGPSPGWSFVDPAHPMAAHPDMVFVDGAALRQVGSRGEVLPGTFYVDDDGDRLHLGSDPTGRSVRASTLGVALTVHGAGTVVRGIGVRRYATSVPEKGAVRVLAADVTVEHVVVRDNATQGIYVGGRDLGVRGRLRHVTAEGNGLLGIESSYADGLVVDAVRASGNNVERFNAAPVSGGIKLTRSRNLTVTDSVLADNLGTGLWFDESVHGVTIAGNDVLRNTGNGIAYEISSQAVIADNLVVGNGGTGVKINNASRIEVWNNTVVDNIGRPLWVVQDSRVAGDRDTPGHDPRQSFPDPTVTWLLGPVRIADNVIGGRTAASCLLCAQDTSLLRTPAQIGLTVEGNVFTRPGPSAPGWLATWPSGSPGTRTFPTLEALRAGSGQEAHGIEFVGAPVVDGAYRLTREAVAATAGVARPMPGWIVGLSGGSRPDPWLGARFG